MKTFREITFDGDKDVRNALDLDCNQCISLKSNAKFALKSNANRLSVQKKNKKLFNR